MRRGRHLAACLLLIAACTSTAEPQSDAFQVTAPTFGHDEMPTITVTSGSTTTTVTARPPAPLSAQRTRGVLPDGTVFDIYLEPALEEEVTGISAPIVIDLGVDASAPLGITTFSGDVIGSPVWEDTTYRIPAGSLTVEIEIYGHLIPLIGGDYRSVVEDGIEATTVNQWPVLLLSAPFQWPSDDDILAVEVRYETFSVRPFCDELALTCSTDQEVQMRQIAGWDEEGASWIESPYSRPVSDPHFLDPGPLGPRFAHDVIWTGEEMIVWGGASGDRPPHLVEGAALDPETNTWRMLRPAPISGDQVTRAVWTGSEMVVMSQDAIVAYLPDTNDWQVIGAGLSPALHPGMTVVNDRFIYSWTPFGIAEIERETGVRQMLPELGFGSDDPYRGALRILEGRLIAVGQDTACAGRLFSEWTGTGWSPLPDVSLVDPARGLADCSTPNQTAVAGGRLIIWADDLHPAMAYDPEPGVWEDISQIPVIGTEGPHGPVPMEEGFLVPFLDQTGVYDAATDRWDTVELPNATGPTEMVWAGRELLMWGGACCHGEDPTRFTTQDAWRWTPPTG